MRTKNIEKTKIFKELVNEIVSFNGFNDKQKSNIHKDSSLMDDLAFDALDRIELIMTIEEDYDIWISQDDEEALKTVGDVVELIEKKLKEKKAKESLN